MKTKSRLHKRTKDGQTIKDPPSHSLAYEETSLPPTSQSRRYLSSFACNTKQITELSPNADEQFVSPKRARSDSSGTDLGGGALSERRHPSTRFDVSCRTEDSVDACDENRLGHTGSGLQTEMDDEARLRKGREYISRLVQELKQDQGQLSEVAISEKIYQDTLKKKGIIPYRKVASQLEGVDMNGLRVQRLRGHKLPVTAAVITEDEEWIVSAGKDGRIVKWDTRTGKKVAILTAAEEKGHVKKVLVLAVSSDGKLLASGGEDNKVSIWNMKSGELKDTLKGHKEAVSGLGFRRKSRDLYTASFDRTVKIWDCEEMAYVDTLFGHRGPIHALDVLDQERCVTCSQDRTVAVWKVAEQISLELIGPKYSIECVSLLTEDRFVSGTQDGAIQLWTSSKRKYEYQVESAHGAGTSEHPNWITAVACMRFTDLFASGSATGEIRFWRVVFKGGEESARRFELVNCMRVPGVINSLQFSNSGSKLVVGVGQEHRFGRWFKVQEAKNEVLVIDLPVIRG
ncbi:U3 small nucleolar RNA-interacting protein 2-like [Schistocerca gregaria]|uniref:U3 small nucleolar RNA-interacting protein 2-like n=1 Tax=Schistocerca gregaria TaxID=7010 RepID=UPI00211ECD32|nr:U3 small nucleolar RNA-interacting protein 2-like [Schistocerca gregaria]